VRRVSYREDLRLRKFSFAHDGLPMSRGSYGGLRG
jgi:hypothetical protein